MIYRYVYMGNPQPLDNYSYKLPEELFATVPARPPESARLLCYDTATDTISITTFADIVSVLPPRTVLVRNTTTVVQAKIIYRYEGESYDAIVLANEPILNGIIRILLTGQHQPGEQGTIGGVRTTLVELDGPAWCVRIDGVQSAEQVCDFLEKVGSMPLPPYILKRDPDIDLETQMEYQTPFATSGVSVASPTASLHFSPCVVDALTHAGHAFADVLLNVGRGTFGLVTDEMVRDRILHSEEYCIPKETEDMLARARHDHVPIVAIGTTVARTLESYMVQGTSTNWTTLFIQPPYTFTGVDILITNFHVPRSSLMALVDAFLEHKGARRRIMEIYQYAIEQKMRFYSFGDGMIIK